MLWYNINMKYEKVTNVVYSCKYHVVWCPKYRRKVLVDGVDVRLKELLFQFAGEMGAEILKMEVAPDRVYLLMDVPPSIGINRAVRHLKGASSRVLRSEYPSLKSRLPCLWTNSYFVSTDTAIPSREIDEYIAAQQTHQ